MARSMPSPAFVNESLKAPQGFIDEIDLLFEDSAGNGILPTQWTSMPALLPPSPEYSDLPAWPSGNSGSDVLGGDSNFDELLVDLQDDFVKEIFNEPQVNPLQGQNEEEQGLWPDAVWEVSVQNTAPFPAFAGSLPLRIKREESECSRCGNEGSSHFTEKDGVEDSLVGTVSADSGYEYVSVKKEEAGEVAGGYTGQEIVPAYGYGRSSATFPRSWTPNSDGCDCSDCQKLGFNAATSTELAQPGVVTSDRRPKALLTLADRPTWPGDISARLAALVGPIDSAVAATSVPPLTQQSLSGVSVPATTRPPSKKALQKLLPPSQSSSGGSAGSGGSGGSGGSAEEALSVQPSIKKRSRRQRKLVAADGTVRPPPLAYPSPTPTLEGSFSKEATAIAADAKLKQHLVAFAEAIATDDQVRQRLLAPVVSQQASYSGNVMQRLAHYFSIALKAKVNGTGSEAYSAPFVDSKDELSFAMDTCCSRLPYMQFAYEGVNSTILEAVAGERRVHIVDLGMWVRGQWLPLLRQLAAQPGGPPHVRLTAVHCSWVGNPLKGYLQVHPALLGIELEEATRELDIPFEFNVVESRLENLRPGMLDLRDGEVVVVSETMRFSSLSDSTVVRSSPRDTVLQLLRQINPRVACLVETDVDQNGLFFMERFKETLDYFQAMFEAEDFVYRRECPFRRRFEEDYLGRDIINVVACEGLQREVRSERLEKWQARMGRAGFVALPMSGRTQTKLRTLLLKYPFGFAMKSNRGAAQLLWHDRPLLAASAWQPYL